MGGVGGAALMTLTVYKASDGWRWKLLARNGRNIANGSEAYASRANAVRAAGRLPLVDVVLKVQDE
jgi:uncharacterized protein YegP (UPF0339 family)